MGSDDYLAQRALALVEDQLDKRVQRIINEVHNKLTQGEELDAQYAIQQWLSLHAAVQLKKSLTARAKSVE